jgi:MinD superfamily P-loop ATPase
VSEPAAQGTRLHIVSGKGGTGKTTVAAALALAVASGGRNVLLCEVEGRQGIAQLFDVSPLPYEERKVAVAPDGGDVYALAIDAEERCSSTCRCTTSWAAPGAHSTASASSTSRPPSHPGCATCC